MVSKKFKSNQDYTANLHNKARNLATRDLIDLHRGQYETLRALYLEKLKTELEWVDLRTVKAKQKELYSNKRNSDDGA